VKCGEGIFKDFEFNDEKSVCAEKCGDGKRFTDNDFPAIPYYIQCDDGNKEDGDGCSKSCKTEEGWSCVGGSNTTADKCTEVTRPTAQLRYFKRDK
jgi:cysteine-rich repeat protein